MPDSTKAVFLSYASEDAEAARRIADALRGFGIEVWFDQNELRGGDQWDAKIRGQIKACGIFMAVISKTTEARDEAYFRREWKLAEDRTHDMAPGKAFIVPVVIDDTPEHGAAVPDSFTKAHWTRLPGGVPSTAFIDQVKRLLQPAKAVGQFSAAATSSAPVARGTPRRNRLPGLVLGVAAVVVVGILIAVVVGRKSVPSVDRSASASDKSIAVLPFENLSPDPENAFFCDGVHEDVITALAKIHDLKVISRTSVLGYKGDDLNLKQVGAELGVAHVLEGSVRRAGNRVRVTAQLIDARTDEHLWAETYTVDLTDVFTVQSELATAITTALKATLSSVEKSLIARRPTDNQEAYDLYLRARSIEESGPQFPTAREQTAFQASLYEQAVALDPNFTQAYVQMCIAHGRVYWFGDVDPASARPARAKAALDRVLQLAPDTPEARLAQGAYAYSCENDWAQALAYFQAAAAGLPNDAQLRFYIGTAQRRLGRFSDSLASMARAIELDPVNPQYVTNQGHTLSAMRRFTELRDLATKALVRLPDNYNLLRIQSRAQLELDHDRAAYWERERERPDPEYADDFGKAQRAFELTFGQGDLAAAERALDDPRLNPPFFRERVTVPVAQARALVAFLQGRAEDARGYAEEALDYYATAEINSRSEAWLMVERAQTHALAAHADEAVRLARTAVAMQVEKDAFDDGRWTRRGLAQVYLLLDRRNDAFATLREMMTSPCIDGPEQIRMDPLWARVADDPRFEEILQSAKPL